MISSCEAMTENCNFKLMLANESKHVVQILVFQLDQKILSKKA